MPTFLSLSLEALYHGDPAYLSGWILPLPCIYLLVQLASSASFLRTPEPAISGCLLLPISSIAVETVQGPIQVTPPPVSLPR